MTIGQRIAQLRNKRQMSQTALAQKAGIPLSTINMLEAGIRSGEGIRVKTARRIASALGVTLDFLCGPYEPAGSEVSPTELAGS